MASQRVHQGVQGVLHAAKPAAQDVTDSDSDEDSHSVGMGARESKVPSSFQKMIHKMPTLSRVQKQQEYGNNSLPSLVEGVSSEQPSKIDAPSPAQGSRDRKLRSCC